ncbi:MAG TPA: flavin reductase family protein [Thermomicrobiales bacterium]|nr:flavin reductase family protein [Thermomicrobiales bacterium]
MPDRPRNTIRPDHIAPLDAGDDARVLAAGEMYHLLNAAIAPRPVAWVSTVDVDGRPNLAPHSYTTVFSTNPAVVGFVSVGRKDSLNNAEATREFVLNIASISLIQRLNTTAANFPPEEDEFDWAGLTHVPSDVVRPPRVGEAPVSFETRVRDIIPIGNSFLILGEVVRVHVAEDVWRDGRIDPTLLDPVLRLAGSMFAHLGETFELPRPTYQDVLARQQQEGDAG